MKSASSLRVYSKIPLKLRLELEKIESEFLWFEKRIRKSSIFVTDQCCMVSLTVEIRPRFQFLRYSLNMASLDKVIQLFLQFLPGDQQSFASLRNYLKWLIFEKIESLSWICFLPYLPGANAKAKQSSAPHVPAILGQLIRTPKVPPHLKQNLNDVSKSVECITELYSTYDKHVRKT